VREKDGDVGSNATYTIASIQGDHPGGRELGTTIKL
jgi:hypothetical protein